MFESQVFRADVARIVARYKEMGFFDAAVDTTIDRSRPGAVRLGIKIVEGEAVRVSRLDLEGFGGVPDMDSTGLRNILLSIPGQPLSKTALEKDQREVLRRLQNKGYAFAEVTGDIEVKRDSKRAVVAFRVIHGPVCRFGDVSVEGNQKVSDGIIRRGLTFQRGEVYQMSKILDSQRELYRAGVFRSVSLALPDSLEQSSPVPMVVSVSERRPRSLKLGAGYDTEEQIRGSITWQHRNFLGGARRLALESAASSLEMSATLGIRQPYVFGSRTWLSLSGFIEQDRPEEIRVKRFGGSASLERTFRSTGRLVFEIRTELVDFQADSTRTNFILAYQEDTRDDFFDPQRGAVALITLEESGHFFQSEQELLKLTGEGRWYRRIRSRGVLAFRVSAGWIRELGKTREVPNFERFFSGGARSVRGWRLNQLGPRDAAGVPVGGLSQLEGGIELRYRIFPVVGAAIFLDGGNVGSGRLDAFDLTTLKWSAGYGLRYLSPIGPLRVDVAHRLSEDSLEPGRRIYFSFGQAF